MVIQRLQTLWLLIAAIMMAIFCFVPMAVIPVEATELAPAGITHLMPIHLTGYFVMNILITLLLFLAIFLYKNTKRQKTVTLVSMLLIAVSMTTEALLLFNWDSTQGKVEWLGSIFLLLGALIFALMAWRGIRHDENLLKAADRLR